MKKDTAESVRVVDTESSRDLAHLAMDQSADLIWMIDGKDFRLQYANQFFRKHARKLLGMKVRLGAAPQEACAEEAASAALWTKLYRRAKREEFSVEFPSRGCFFNLRFQQVHADSARTSILVTATDITSWKKRELELDASEELFRGAFDRANIGVCLVSVRGVFLNVNRELCHMLGYRQEELVGKKFNDFTLEADRALGSEMLRRLETGKIHTCQFEKRYRCKDGRIMWASVSVSAVRNPQAGTLHLVSSIQDISAKKRHMEETQLSEERYRNLVENQPALISRSDLEGRLTFVNPACCETFKKTSRELIGTPFLDLVVPEDRPVCQQVLRDISQPPHRKRSENRVLTSSGVRHFRWENSAIQDESGRIIEVQAVGFDITDEKNSEAVLRESEQRYRRLARQLELVNKTGLNIAAGLKFEDLMNTLYQECRQIVDIDTFYLALLDASTRIVSFPIYYEEGQRKTFAPVSLKEKPGLIAHIVRTRRTFYCPDAEHFPADIPLIRLPGKVNQSALGVPLVINDRVIGVLSIQSHMKEAYSPEQVSMLESLATQAAIAIQNSQLYENVQQEKALTDALLDNIPEFFFLVDRHGKLMRWNKQSAALWGNIPGAAQGLELDRLIVSEGKVRLAEILAQALESGRVRREIQLTLLDGRRMPIILVVTRHELGEDTVLLGVALDITEQKILEADIRNSYQQLHDTFISSIDLLARISGQRDSYTAGHQERVSHLAVAIAQEMGLSESVIEGIKVAGTIHDIGKISLPSELLSKPSRLSSLEFDLIKTHAQNGYDILSQYTFPWPLAEIIYQHHERLDGSGYPLHLQGSELLLEARILAVADVVEAMSSHRPYRPALGLDKAIQELKEQRGILYDEEIVDVVMRLHARDLVKL